jgi:hypothetical protein
MTQPLEPLEPLEPTDNENQTYVVSLSLLEFLEHLPPDDSYLYLSEATTND